MKKLIFVLPLLVLACKKEAPISETLPKDSSALQSSKMASKDSSAIRDSIVNNSPIVDKVTQVGVNREVKGEEIIRMGDGEQVPFTVGEEFTKDNQKLILKIKNFEGKNISASVKPQKSDMNIRISQIKLTDGSFDGPFSQELQNYKIPKKGEVWLIINKNQMASGDAKGHFTVTVN